jgi:hypothetical protein
MEATLTFTGDTVKIYVDGILHLCFRDRIIAIQAWKEERNWWKIEVVMTSKTVLLEYDSPDKWEQIINLLDKHT